METVISLIIFATFASFIVGLIRPKALERIFQTSGRVKITAINLGLMFGSAIVGGIVAPPSEAIQKDLVEPSVQVNDVSEATDALPEPQNSPVEAEPVEDSQVVLSEPSESNPGVETSTATFVESTPEPQVETIFEPDPEPVAEPESTPVQEPTPQTEPVQTSPSCYCEFDSLNCADFGSHAEAQNYYECCFSQVGYDVHGLDGDDDRSACETLP